MSRKKYVLPVLFVLALAVFLSREKIRLPEPSAAAVRPRAFLQAEWGMTPEEVEAVNGRKLSEPGRGKKFYQAEEGAEADYRTLETRSQKFLGREAVVSYTFQKGRLRNYHVFVSGADEQELDALMRAYLTRTFGSGAEQIEDGSVLKMIWQSRGRVVNYWFYEEPNALSQPYRAGFGVQVSQI